jgi:hypothetical protein
MRAAFLLAKLCLAAVFTAAVFAQEKTGDRAVSLGDGKLTLNAPEGWTKKQPASRIIEAEFATPPAKGDETPGRLTAMGAGGSVEQNVDRWVAQFVGEGGAAAKPKLDKVTVGGAEVHVVDLSGTYKDTPGGPFAGKAPVMRENYRMLGAIIQTKDAGNYFLKLYGPKATINEAEKGFHEMVKSLKVK